MEFEIFLHGINVVEDVVDNSWNNPLHGGVIDDTLHRVGFTRRRLSIGKYGSVVATQNICEKINVKEILTHFSNVFITLDNILRGGVIHLILGDVRLQHFVKHVEFALQKYILH